MGRAVIPLHGMADKAKATLWIHKAPWGTRVTFDGPKRSLPANSRFHAMLTDVSEQVTWYGRKWSVPDWKDWFKHMLRTENRWMPGEDGAPVPIGWSSAEWSAETMGEAMELIAAFGARHGVAFRDDARAALGWELGASAGGEPASAPRLIGRGPGRSTKALPAPKTIETLDV